MSFGEHREKAPYIIYTVPPSLDAKTWSEIQLKWAEVRLKEVEAEREKTRALIELAREGINSLKDYYLKKIPRATLPAHILISTVVIGTIILTWLGKVEGETFAFLMGTVVGYIISLLSKHM